MNKSQIGGHFNNEYYDKEKRHFYLLEKSEEQDGWASESRNMYNRETHGEDPMISAKNPRSNKHMMYSVGYSYRYSYSPYRLLS